MCRLEPNAFDANYFASSACNSFNLDTELSCPDVQVGSYTFARIQDIRLESKSTIYIQWPKFINTENTHELYAFLASRSSVYV